MFLIVIEIISLSLKHTHNNTDKKLQLTEINLNLAKFKSISPNLLEMLFFACRYQLCNSRKLGKGEKTSKF